MSKIRIEGLHKKDTPIFLVFLNFALAPHSDECERYLAYADVQEAISNAEKAVLLVLLVLNYDLSQKAVRAFGVNLNVVRKAVKANKEGRTIGRKGRLPKLNEDEKGELKTTVEKMIKEHQSPTR
jgi:hypothetical protein